MRVKDSVYKLGLMLGKARRATSSRSAFTMIEMLVVLGMLGILMGVTFGGIGSARSRARVAKATAEVRELVNAILAYEVGQGRDFDLIAASPQDATESNIKDLIGDGGGPVYLNAALDGGAFRDPWGTPYRFRVIPETVSSEGGMAESVSATVTFPNRQRGQR